MDNSRFEEGRNSYKKILKNIKYDLKQDIIISGLVQSLAHISLTKIAINLFQYDLCDDADQLFKSNQPPDIIYKYFCCELLNLVESNVHAKSSSLILTLPCKNALNQIIKVIKDEIEEFFSQHLDLSSLNVWDVEEIVLIYYANLCWTQEGKINIVQTMINIIENSNLATIDKYILACDNCLEDNILNLLKILPENLIDKLINVDNAKNERKKKYVLVTFWTYHLRGKQAKFSELINGRETYKYLLNWTINNHKKLAWYYFWENFADDAMKEENLELVESNEYISLMYLLTQFNQEKIEDFYNIEIVGIYFVNMLDRISKSCKIVLVPYYILDYITTHSDCNSFEIINHSWNNRHININEHIKIWKDFIVFLNNDSEDYTKSIHRYLYLSLIILNNWNIFEVIVKFSPYQTKKDFLYESKKGFKFCKKILIQVPDHFNKIIKLLLVSEEEISKFNKILFSDRIFDEILHELIINDKFEILKEILLMLCSTEEINKNELPFNNNASIILKILKCSKDSNLLNLLNKFISWCYDGTDEEVTRCKAEIFDLKTQLYVEHKEEIFNNFKELIRTKKWDLVDKFGMWIFFATKDKIDSSKKKMERIKNIFYHTSRKDYCLLLKRFITSCFNHNEYDDLKEILTHNIILVAVQNLLNLDSHEEADNLLDWRFSSNKKEITAFKNLFMSIVGRELLVGYIKRRIDIAKVETLFLWFNPSLESANIFKEEFLNYMKNKRELLQLRHCKNQSKICFRIWTIISIRTIETLALLSNYVEETKLVEKESNITIKDNAKEKKKKRENGKVLLEKRKKNKLF